MTGDPHQRIERERDFWDHEVPTVAEAIAEYHKGPEPNTRLMMEVVRPHPGMRILDFACGAGVTSAWLADKGADVTGVDLSPVSICVADEMAAEVGARAHFLAEDVEKIALPEGGFDAIVGRYALHHLDVAHMAPVLARCLKPGGVGAFVETMGINPVLRFARNHMVGRFGIPRFGTLDEHPLRWSDIQLLSDAFGDVRLVNEEYRFLTMLDRQVLHGRVPMIVPALRRADAVLSRIPKIDRWSFHQVLVVGEDRGLVDRALTNAPPIFERITDQQSHWRP
jgi:ubiquinone/menaquinone biosynthesis C-methylase UbiE